MEHDQNDEMGHSSTEFPVSNSEIELSMTKIREKVIDDKLRALQGFSFPTPETPDSDPSGALVYIETYKKSYQSDKDVDSSDYPMIGVPSDLRNSNDILDLSCAGLGTRGSFALAAALRVNSSIQILILLNNYITTSGALAIVNAIIESRNVTEVNFFSNHIGAVESLPGVNYSLRGGDVIKKLIYSGSLITKLSLGDNHLSDADLQILSETLAENITLQHLDLSYNKLSYIGAIELAKVLSRNADLREINLEWNHFGAAGCQILLSQGFLFNNTIKSFNLSACGLDDTCAVLVSRIISENATEQIIIANNRISAAGVDSIIKGIVATTSLTTLVLDGNYLGDDGCSKLLNTATSGAFKTLTLLSFQHCGCSAATEARSQNAAMPDGFCIRVSEGYSVINTL
ncbi:unnamed protein product [Phytomonas sp. Hart1]|nr:unnamed protein product [Phytomonas sp. Hart1]|eukprot:CCW71068.1 unnamed protein product [Phytomonas sp. isolate Hart1]